MGGAYTVLSAIQSSSSLVVAAGRQALYSHFAGEENGLRSVSGNRGKKQELKRSARILLGSPIGPVPPPRPA